MSGQCFIFYRQMKNGKWRLYKNESQSIMSWRGDNDKITVIRNYFNDILNFDSKDQAITYSREVLKSTAQAE